MAKLTKMQQKIYDYIAETTRQQGYPPSVREIGEETGVPGAKIAAFLCNTVHAYDVYGVWELKTTHWYLLSADGECGLQPQESEGIERAEWCDAGTVERNLRDTYPTIRRVFDKYGEIKEKVW